MIVFLIGYMGCGKSTLGRQMANVMGYEFLDTDEMVERIAGLSIAEIFAQKGEDAFRATERAVLESFAGKDKIIISTGGGLACFGDNISFMNEIGFTVYIDVPVDTLIHRISKTGSKRPLIAQKNEQELKAFICDNISLREPFYKQAMMTVSGRSVRAEDIIQLINIKIKY